MLIDRNGTDEQASADQSVVLEPDWIEIEPPNECLAHWSFEQIKAYGDSWNNNNVSARNLVHQLHSLRRLTLPAQEGDADVVIFARPDLMYWDSIGPVLDQALSQEASCVYLPAWQPWGGYNDRFAIAVGSTAIAAYGRRIEKAIEFCEYNNSPLHSEKLVKYALEQVDTQVKFINVRASRVRASGLRVWESFGNQAESVRHQRRKALLWAALDKSGAKNFLKAGYALLKRGEK